MADDSSGEFMTEKLADVPVICFVSAPRTGLYSHELRKRTLWLHGVL